MDKEAGEEGFCGVMKMRIRRRFCIIINKAVLHAEKLFFGK